MIGGLDEAGRGPLAGPVVAAVVILPPRHGIRGIDDSKALSPETRQRLAIAIRRRCVAFGIGWADAAEIDTLNILEATFLAMRRALLAMPVTARELLIDGNRLPQLADLKQPPGRAIIGGDARETCIGAASILAKTMRDSYMDQAHTIYPSYLFSDHKGYGTAAHRQALAVHGPCPLHRRTFAPVRDAWEQQQRQRGVEDPARQWVPSTLLPLQSRA